MVKGVKGGHHLAHGTPLRNTEKLQVCVYFDRETFAQVRKQAKKRKVSFTEMVRLLVEWGLEGAA